MNKISIIIPVYNVENYLKKCIMSIIDQTYKNLEIILVDDGSTDSSGKICDFYSTEDNRIKVIHKKNGGLSDARNTGIEQATGEYLMFIDSDDYIDKTMCEKLYNALKLQNTEMAICGISCVDKNGIGIPEMNQYSPLFGCKMSKNEIFNKLSDKNYWHFVVAWNKIYHRKIFEKIRFPFGKIHEDEFVFHHILNVCNNVAIVRENLYFYVQRENSIVNSPKSIKSLDGAEAFFDRVEFALNKGMDKLALISADYGLNCMFECYAISKQSIYNKKRFDQVHKTYKNLYKIMHKLGVLKIKKLYFFIAYLGIGQLLFMMKIKKKLKKLLI